MCKYAVVDLEMCEVPKSRKNNEFHWNREIIQIGAVLLDEEYKVIDQFMTYVTPEYGYLNTRIRTLTGITDRDLYGAPVFMEALKMFTNWLPVDVKMVSWSDSDKHQISYEMEAKRIENETMAALFDGWIDSQRLFGEKIGAEKEYNLTNALCVADIDYQDGAHDGLVDAYNTALLFAKVETESEFKLNEYYVSAQSEEREETVYSLAGLFAGINLQELAIA